MFLGYYPSQIAEVVSFDKKQEILETWHSQEGVRVMFAGSPDVLTSLVSLDLYLIF